MKEQFIQLGLEQHAASRSESIQWVRASAREAVVPVFDVQNSLTTQAESPHTDGREVILMDSRGELIGKPPVEAQPLGQPRVLTPEQVATARTVPAQDIKNELGYDVQRLQGSQDASVADRLKYWFHEFRQRRHVEKYLKQKKTEDEYVDELMKFNTDVIGSGEGIRDKEILSGAGITAILKQAEANGFSSQSILGKYMHRSEPAAKKPEAALGQNGKVSGDGVEFKQDAPRTKEPIPLDEHFPPGPIRDVIERHNKNVGARGFPYSTQQMLELYNQLLEARRAQTYATDETEKARQLDLIDAAENALHSQIAETYGQEYGGGRSRDDYMAIGRVFRPGTEELARREDIFIDRAVRDEVFNNLFANADSQTNEFFDRAWNPLSDGIMYEAFMTDLRKASQGDIPDNILTEWIQSRTGQREGEPETDRARMKLLMQQELAEEGRRYAKERNVRKSLHDANAIINIPRLEAEQVFGYIEQFGSDLQDYATRMTGVRQMMDIFEMQTRQVMAENDGYLPPSAIQEASHTETQTDSRGNPFPGSEVDRPEIEKRSKLVFENMLKRGAIVLRDEKTGEPLRVGDLKPWQIDRIYATARGMSLLSMRLLSLAAESSLPPNGEFTSLFMQDVLQTYSPYIHLMAKFYVPSSKVLASLLYKEGRDELKDYIAQGIPEDMGWLRKLSELAPNVRLPVSRKQLEDMYHTMAHDGKARDVLEGDFGSLLELRKQNPMRCGDAFTYLTWRAGTEVKDLTASREFLRNGAVRMATIHLGGVDAVRERLGRDLTVSDLLGKKQNLRYASLTDKGLHESPTEDDIMAINAYVLEHGGDGVTTENRQAILELQKKIGEHGNWIGTGFRFERLRSKLELWKSDKPEEQKDFAKAKAKAEKLLERIVEIQPHRIYLKSKIIQKRLSDNPQFTRLGPHMQEIQENLSFLETSMYQMREDLLKDGFTFDGENGNKFTLEDIYERVQAGPDGSKLPHEGAWAATKDFIQIMQNDFDQNKDKGATYYTDRHTSHGETVEHKKYSIEQTGYFQEFIYERDYHHGYVLWSGDAPLEEFHFTNVGGTGGFIRRAGENKDVMGGTKAMLELVSHLHDQYITPDAVYGKLYEIYAANKSYDIEQARKTVANLAEGMIKFFGEQSIARLPVVGEIAERMGFGSFAQVIYGKRAPAWSTTEIQYFTHDLLKEHGVITQEQYEHLEKSYNSTRADHFVNVGQTIAQLAALAALLYILKESVEEATK